MSQMHNDASRSVKQGKSMPYGTRADETDDLAARGAYDDTDEAGRVRPDPEVTQANDNTPVSQGTVPLEENQRHPSDPLKPGEEDEYGTRLEKALSKVVPPGREVKDEDILDPGHMTPKAPPVDNRS